MPKNTDELDEDALYELINQMEKEGKLGDKDEYREFIRTIFKIPFSTGNQAKFPSNSNHKAYAKNDKNSRKFATVNRNTTDYSAENDDDPTMQHLRWISSYMLALLFNAGKSDVQEVQALWDGTNIFIAENQTKNTRAIQKSVEAKMQPDISKLKSKISDQDLLERMERHIGQLNNSVDATSEVINAFKAGNIVYVTAGPPNMHAEVRLAEYWLNDNDTGEFATVAGIKRPCFACFSRLTDLASSAFKNNRILNHKPRPGLFWPTGAALKGIPKGGALEILDGLLGDPKFHLTYNKTLQDSDSEQSESGFGSDFSMSGYESDDLMSGYESDDSTNPLNILANAAREKLLNRKSSKRKGNESSNDSESPKKYKKKHPAPKKSHRSHSR